MSKNHSVMLIGTKMFLHCSGCGELYHVGDILTMDVKDGEQESPPMEFEVGGVKMKMRTIGQHEEAELLLGGVFK